MDIYDKSGPGARSSSGGYGFGRMSGVQGFRRVPGDQGSRRSSGGQGTRWWAGGRGLEVVRRLSAKKVARGIGPRRLPGASDSGGRHEVRGL